MEPGVSRTILKFLDTRQGGFLELFFQAKNLIVLAMSMTLLTSACTSSDEPSAISSEIIESAEEFQTPQGMFIMPEAAGHQPKPSVVATVHYSDLAPTWSSSNLGQDGYVHLDDVEKTSDFGQAHGMLRLSELAADERITDQSLDAQLTSDLDWFRALVPGTAQDPGSEIAILWLWADIESIASTSIGAPPQVEELQRRFDDVKATDVEDHPFLIYRLVQIADLLDFELSEDLSGLVRGLPERLLPPPSSTNAILDALAIQRMRATQDANREVDPSYFEELMKKSEEEVLGDDLSVAAVLGLLEASSSRQIDEFEAQIADSVRMRIDESTGLVVPISTAVPTVEATFAFSRLLEGSMAEIVSEETIERLVQEQSDGDRPLSQRLKATYVLRESGHDEWDQLDASKVQSEFVEEFPSQIDAENLNDYLNLMITIAHLYPDWEKRDLVEFDLGADAELEQLAAASLRYSYLFANESDVRRMFPELQDSLSAIISDNTVPFGPRILATATLAATDYEFESSTVLLEIGSSMAQMRGCRDGLGLYSVDGEDDSLCSLQLTIEARNIPLALQ